MGSVVTIYRIYPGKDALFVPNIEHLQKGCALHTGLVLLLF